MKRILITAIRLCFSRLILCLALTSFLFALNSPAQNIVSRPAGVVRIEVGAQEQKLISIPFKPLDSSVNAILERQLTGSTNAQTADSIVKWNSSQASYTRAVKVSGTGNPEIDGKWFKDISALELSDMTLNPGEGFFICNRQGSNQTIVLAGEVVLDSTNYITLMPALNLISYPYSMAAGVEDTAFRDLSNSITEHGVTGAVERFKAGSGYWHDRKADDSCIWMEIRPYADMFPAEGLDPYISGIQVRDASGIKLEIRCSGVEGEKLDVYYKDITSTGRLDTAGGWKGAERGIETKGATVTDWIDAGDANRPPPGEIFGRDYIIGRADIDADASGVPDAMEVFILGSRSITRHADGSMALVPASAPGSATESSPSDVPGSAEVFVPGETNLPVNLTLVRVIYVDHKTGNDALSGKSLVVVGEDGPKKTVKSGLSAAATGDKMVIRQGSYGEDLNIVGKDISVTVEGIVNLSGTPPPENEPVPQESPTNCLPAQVPAGGI